MAPVSQWSGQFGLFFISQGNLARASQYLPDMQRRLSYEISFCTQVIECELLFPLYTSMTSQKSRSYQSYFYSLIMIIFEQLDALTLVIEFLQKKELLRLSLLSSRTRHLLNSHPQISISIKKYRNHLMKNVVKTNFDLLKKDKGQPFQLTLMRPNMITYSSPVIGRPTLPFLSALFKECWIRRKQALQSQKFRISEKQQTEQRVRRKRQSSRKRLGGSMQEINKDIERVLELNRQQQQLKRQLNKLGTLVKGWAGLN